MSVIDENNVMDSPPPPPIERRRGGRGLPPRRWVIILDYKGGYESDECKRFLQEAFNFTAAIATAHLLKCIRSESSIVFRGPQDITETKLDATENLKAQRMVQAPKTLGLMQFRIQRGPL